MMDLTDPAAAIRTLAGAPRPEVENAVAELAGPAGATPSGTQLLVRAAANVRLYELDSSPATLARALADHDASPVFGPQRDAVTRRLLLAQVQAAVRGHDVDMRRVAGMLDVPDDPDRPGTLAVLQGLALVAGALIEEPGYDLDAALNRLEEISAALPPHSEYAAILPAFHEALLVARRQRIGKYGDPTLPEDLSTSFNPNSAQWLRTELLRLAGEAMSAAQRGDIPSAVRVVPEIEDIVDQLPLDDPATGQMRVLISQLKGLMGGSTEAMRMDADQSGLSRAERAARLFMSATADADQAAQRQDAQGFAAATARMRDAVDVAPPDDPQLSNYLTVLGRSECTLFQLRRQRADLAGAIGHLEAAVHAADRPGQPMWSMAASALALAYRLDGRLADGRHWGLRSLRGNAWTVLLQDTPQHATEAARHAAGEGVEVARWCLADGDSAGAAVALDAGRGLMLAATRVTAGVPERLLAAGHPELAERWRRQGGQNDPATGSDLRHEVLTALAGRTGHALLDPPDVHEVRAALHTMDADALIYLLPADATGSGAAIFVPRDEAPYHLALAKLAARAGEQVHRYGQTLATRDAGVKHGPQPTRHWRAALDDLCGWAWSTVVGPLLDDVRRWGLDRSPRLVLVPMGELATVPWHAARSPQGRYAVQDAVFSYTPSARILCDCVWRPPVDADSGSLVVGDPTGDLPDARDEAVAIRDAYYPSATLLGDGDATPSAVLEWLRPGTRSLLHLSCHGALGRGGAYLSLAGRAELTARQLVEARDRATIGLVVLAACTTGVPSGSYDEAFSISSAFLATGAATVFGSLWAVPDDATSLLMFMAHHYLRVKGRRPADALHCAQLWMLDPDRQVPPEMPAMLAGRVPLVDRHDVAAWAAFTHLGA